MFKFLGDLMVNLLNYLRDLTGNYGMAIILTTVIIKLVLLPLSIKQEKSMRQQQKIKPLLDKLNEKYKGKTKDAEYQKELQEIYKSEGVNPFLGCLPLLIQFPILIMLYRTFNSPDVLNGNEQFLWFYLDKPDAFYILNLPIIGALSINLLPIISAVLQFLQQKLLSNNNQNDEKDSMASSMQSTMLMLPFIMLFLFYKMPAGLNLYFVVSTLLGIIQSYVFLMLRKSDENGK